MLDGKVEPTVIDGTVFWHADPPAEIAPSGTCARMLQGFDECVLRR